MKLRVQINVKFMYSNKIEIVVIIFKSFSIHHLIFYFVKNSSQKFWKAFLICEIVRTITILQYEKMHNLIQHNL